MVFLFYLPVIKPLVAEIARDTIPNMLAKALDDVAVSRAGPIEKARIHPITVSEMGGIFRASPYIVAVEADSAASKCAALTVRVSIQLDLLEETRVSIAEQLQEYLQRHLREKGQGGMKVFVVVSN